MVLVHRKKRGAEFGATESKKRKRKRKRKDLCLCGAFSFLVEASIDPCLPFKLDEAPRLSSFVSFLLLNKQFVKIVGGSEAVAAPRAVCRATTPPGTYLCAQAIIINYHDSA